MSAALPEEPEGAGRPVRLEWQQAVVVSVRRTTPDGVVLRLRLPRRLRHLPGQHYVVRLTAEDGYTAQRSYSVASAPADPLLELYVQGLPDGEVSGHLTEVVEPGDTFEVRGPVGRWFVWRGDRPALAVGGGSGVVPLVAMLRHARDLGRTDLLGLAVSARSRAELPYAGELADAGARLVLTREAGPDGRPPGRLVPDDLAPLLTGDQDVLVCGSDGFAETATGALLALGVAAETVRVERFGPS